MQQKFATQIRNIYGDVVYQKIDDWKMTKTRLATIMAKPELPSGEYQLIVRPANATENENIGNLKFLD